MIIKNIGSRIHRVIWSCQLTIIRTFTVLFNRLDALELLYDELSVSLGYRIENAIKEIDYLEKSVTLLSQDLKNFGIDSSVVDNIIVDVQAERGVADALKDELNAPLVVDEEKDEEKPSEKPMDTELMITIDKELDRIAEERQKQIDENRERLERAQDLTEKVEAEKKNVEEATKQLKQELEKQQQEMQQNLDRLKELADSGYDNDYSDVKGYTVTPFGTLTGDGGGILDRIAEATGMVSKVTGEEAKALEKVLETLNDDPKTTSGTNFLTNNVIDASQAAVEQAYQNAKQYLEEHPGDYAGASEKAKEDIHSSLTETQKEAVADAIVMSAQNVIDAQNAAAGIEAAKEKVAELEKQISGSEKVKEKLDEISSLIESATTTIQESIRHDSSISASEAVHNVGADAISTPNVSRPDNYIGESVSREEQQKMEDAYAQQQRAYEYFTGLYSEGWHP